MQLFRAGSLHCLGLDLASDPSKVGQSVKVVGDWYGDYGNIGCNTWLRMKNNKADSLIEEYRTWGEYYASSDYTKQSIGYTPHRLASISIEKLTAIPRTVP